MSAIIKFHTRIKIASYNTALVLSKHKITKSVLKQGTFSVWHSKMAWQMSELGEAAAPSAERALISAHTAHTCSHKARQSLHMVYSENGAAAPWTSLRLLPELGQLSMDHFTGVTGKSNYKVGIISAELIEMPILRFFSHKYFWQCSTSQIFSSLLMSRRYCTAANIPRADPRNQHWTWVERMHQFRLPEGCQALCLLQWEPSQGND